VPQAYPEEAFVVEGAKGQAPLSASLEMPAEALDEPEFAFEAEHPGEPDLALEHTDDAFLVETAEAPEPIETVETIELFEPQDPGAPVVTPAPASDTATDIPLDAPAPGDLMDGADIRTDPSETPSFVRRAEREARWRRPRVRAALAAACLVAALALAAQGLVAQRDLVAARSPALRPLLAAACAALGCEVQAPRSLDALRVESSGVLRIEKSDLYRLSVALRNLRPHEVAWPAFELALTDTQGQLIARRVLRASEFGTRAGAVGAGSEVTLQCTIQVASGTVAGYTIELFYP